MKFNILFLGTPAFAIPALEKLHQEHQVIAVVTQPDKPVGRKQILTPPPVKQRAIELEIPVFQPEKASEIPQLIDQRIDFLVTAAYGQFLPESVLDLAFKEPLNIHPSLLPKYRGATPMQSALLNDDQKTGVSIIRMVKKMDAGPVFNQLQFPLPQEWKYPDLEKKCAEVGAQLVCDVIKNIHSMSPQPQNETEVSYCTKISKQDGEIHWESETAKQIYNKLRAFTPWPGVYTWFKNQKLNLLDFSLVSQPLGLRSSSELRSGSEAGPGNPFTQNNQISIQCAKGSIKLHQVQLAGKKPTDIKSFINGHPDFIGAKL